MFQDIQQSIIDRLTAKLTGITVTTLAELERVPEMRQKAPCVFVVYEGFSPADTTDKQIPHVQRIELRFSVVVATKSAKGNGNVTDAQAENDALAGQVVTALIGYHLGGGKYMRLSSSAGAEYDAGYCYTPIAFSVFKTFKGDPT